MLKTYHAYIFRILGRVLYLHFGQQCLYSCRACDADCSLPPRIHESWKFLYPSTGQALRLFDRIWVTDLHRCTQKKTLGARHTIDPLLHNNLQV